MAITINSTLSWCCESSRLYLTVLVSSLASKREYLLDQIQQKDAVIDSLLKQLHNPFPTGTPASTEDLRRATPSTDYLRHNITEWLDRMQSSSVSTPFDRATVHDLDSSSTRAGTDIVAEEDVEYNSEQWYATLQGQDQNEGDSPAVDVESPLRDVNGNVGVTKNAADMSRHFDHLHKTMDMDGLPDLLVHGLVTPEEVDQLFEMYIPPFVHMLDPILHTPASTFSKCPFLFTIICAISSRYSEKPEIYFTAMHLAKSAAAKALIDGWKSVELCHAYILMSIYATPSRRWEEDRTSLYMGIAFRIAADLNLQERELKYPQTEIEEREMLSKMRLWLVCLDFDRSKPNQFGSSTERHDRVATAWWKMSQYNSRFDVHLVAYSSMMRILDKFYRATSLRHDSLTDPDHFVINFRAVTMDCEGELQHYQKEWAEIFAIDSYSDDDASTFRCRLLPFYVNYSRLLLFSVGLQKASLRGFQPEDGLFVKKSFESAIALITLFVDSLVPTGYIRFAPDCCFVFGTFAAVCLLTLLRPEYATFIAQELESEIHKSISRLAETIGSPKIVVDERHTPKLCSRFLASALS
ncbi:hypothetical protein BV25DRAFT_1803464, partial [Artomyces pyxidatus]